MNISKQVFVSRGLNTCHDGFRIFERNLFYRFQVVATEDQTTERLSSTSEIIVTLIDVNDNKPYFEEESYTVQLSESARAGTSIITLTVRMNK